MLIKCETKSNRVKGLSFHPKLSWILASLHNGVIQLWDYRIGSLVDRFHGHEGPVRGVDFHSSQPLFVSGADDYRVKVWNYRQRRCIFTLLGHLDYIRTVYFHHEYPWILSASDDQTVRIWNWQSRSCLAVLTGHGHYVMCAQFHQKSDLVVSASLDQMIRVWDISGLREKTVSIGGSGPVSGMSAAIMQNHQVAEMFGASDAICKFILEGHDRGVNWAAFHPTSPLIASGADDRHIKLWRYNDSKAWEVDTLRGHFNNVSCVMFHPTKELLLSNSEDRTIRVWDIAKRTAVHTFRRENDRCWVLTGEPDSNLIAVGHDSGMVVFKLDRERPPHECWDKYLFVVRDKHLTIHDLTSDVSSSFVSTRRPTSPICFGPRQLLFNHFSPSEANFLLFYKESDTTVASYDLVTGGPLERWMQNSATNNAQTRTGNGVSVAFVARNRFVVLESSGTLGVYNLSNEIGRRIELPVPVEKVFSATPNRVLLKSEDRVILFDLTTRAIVSEVTCAGGPRHAIWSRDREYLALISKHNLLLATAKLDCLHTLHENIRMKSGCWHSDGVFVYSTLSHVKYCLINGDFGIIHSLPSPSYIFKVEGSRMYYINRHNQVRIDPLNSTEFLFKLALQKQNFEHVALYIKNGRLCGNAVIGYLTRKGYPEVALQFVNEPKTRFNLALEFGHLDEAASACTKMDNKSTWERLAKESMRQGNYEIVETVLQRIKDFDKLSFLYCITGNHEKLRKMLKISEMRKDQMSRFHNALLVGDAPERVKVLADVGQLPLATATAAVHHLDDLSKHLQDSADAWNSEGQLPATPKLLLPPVPVFRLTNEGALNNWPTVGTPKGNVLEIAMEASARLGAEEIHMTMARASGQIPQATVKKSVEAVQGYGFEDEDGANLLDSPIDNSVWKDDDFGELPEDSFSANITTGSAAAAAAGRGDASSKGPTTASSIVTRGDSPQSKWTQGRVVTGDLVSAGQFEEALHYLEKRIALANAGPLKEHFKKVYEAANVSLTGLPQTQSLLLPIVAQNSSLKDPDISPMRLYNSASVAELVRSSHKFVTAGKFQNALNSFQTTLQCLPLAVASNTEEEAQLNGYVDLCRCYITAMRLETTRTALSPEDASGPRNVELAAYFASCKVIPSHRFLILRKAIGICNKSCNYITAAALCNRLLNDGPFLGTNEDLEKARRLFIAAERQGTDKHVVDFEVSERDALRVCTSTLKRLGPTDASVRCPFCSSEATAAFKGKTCSTCQLSELGARVLGLGFGGDRKVF
eukprot:Lankesteria_metandrocarpae@DN4409_c0_g1_i1.p1